MAEPKYLRHDVQAETSGFDKIAIKKVGVRHIKMPLKILSKEGTEGMVVNGEMSAYVDLDESNKGINMSRFARTLMDICENKPLVLRDINTIAEKLQAAHKSDNLYLKINFEYEILVNSPATNLPVYEPIPCCVEIHRKGTNNKINITLTGIQSSCCPCSKNMSLLVNNISDEQEKELEKLSDDLKEKVRMAGFGAHNQRSEITITVTALDNNNLPWLEDLYAITQNSCSAQTFNVLKREDEKWVTEGQYLGGYFDENFVFHKVEGSGPKFVEDISRNTAAALNNILDKVISDYAVVVNNKESIHTTLDATAVITAGRVLQ